MKFVYSAGGYARELLRIIKLNYRSEEIMLVDDAGIDGSIAYDSALELAKAEECSFTVAFADHKLRREKVDRILADGLSLFSVQADTCIIGENVKLGEGFQLSDYTILTADLEIGTSFQCNIYSYVAHDCIVGDYVTLAPRVSVNGRVQIGSNVYIGTGATILPGTLGKPIRIGNGAIVGAHALVTKDVAPNEVVVGSPAKPLPKKIEN